MQGQGWHEKQKYQHDAQFDEKYQDQSAKLLFVDFKEIRRPGDAGSPKQVRRDEIKQGECDADDECAQEKIPKEDDFCVFHGFEFFGMMTASFVAKKLLPPPIQLDRYPPDRTWLQASNKSFSSFAHPLTIWSPLQHLTDFRIGLEK
jgi:hypothetical protein